MFITFEGGEGEGKSTQQKMLMAALQGMGLTPVATREPGGTVLGEKVRKLIMEQKGMSRLAEAFLFNAARVQLVEDVILPAIREGHDVLCDRFIHSTLAYQGYAGGVSRFYLQSLNVIATGNLQPDMVVLLDIDPVVGLQRKNADLTIEWNRFEDEKAAFYQDVRRGFLNMAQKDRWCWRVVDASGDPLTIHQRIFSWYQELNNCL